MSDRARSSGVALLLCDYRLLPRLALSPHGLGQAQRWLFAAMPNSLASKEPERIRTIVVKNYFSRPHPTGHRARFAGTTVSLWEGDERSGGGRPRRAPISRNLTVERICAPSSRELPLEKPAATLTVRLVLSRPWGVRDSKPDGEARRIVQGRVGHGQSYRDQSVACGSALQAAGRSAKSGGSDASSPRVSPPTSNRTRVDVPSAC